MDYAEQLWANMTATRRPKPYEVDIDGWGKLYLRRPMAIDVEEAMETANADAEAMKNKDLRTTARIVSKAICREDGTLVFDPKNDEHLTFLAEQPWDMLSQILDAQRNAARKATEGN